MTIKSVKVCEDLYAVSGYAHVYGNAKVKIPSSEKVNYQKCGAILKKCSSK